jgi:hypothetical protein
MRAELPHLVWNLAVHLRTDLDPTLVCDYKCMICSFMHFDTTRRPRRFPDHREQRHCESGRAMVDPRQFGIVGGNKSRELHSSPFGAGIIARAPFNHGRRQMLLRMLSIAVLAMSAAAPGVHAQTAQAVAPQ